MAKSAKYKTKVLFLEHDADARPARRTRFDSARTKTGQLLLPLVIVDSGLGVTEASARWQPGCSESFCDYPKLVDKALKEPPLLEIVSSYSRVGVTNNLRVFGTVKNTGEVTLGFDNSATLWLMAYEETRPPHIHIDRFVRGTVRIPMDEDLKPGDTTIFNQVIQDLPTGTNMSKVQVVVLIDYQPANPGPFVSAQAAIAEYRQPVPPPPNDDFANRKYIENLAYTDTVDTAGATDEQGEVVAMCGAGADKGVWYEYVPFYNEKVEIDTIGSSYDTVLSVWTSTSGLDPKHPLKEFACSNDDADKNGHLVLDLKQEVPYYIKVGGFDGAVGNATLNMKKVEAVPTTPPPTVAPTTTTPPPTVEPTTPPPPTDVPTDVPTPVPQRHEIFMPMAKDRAE